MRRMKNNIVKRKLQLKKIISVLGCLSIIVSAEYPALASSGSSTIVENERIAEIITYISDNNEYKDCKEHEEREEYEEHKNDKKYTDDETYKNYLAAIDDNEYKGVGCVEGYDNSESGFIEIDEDVFLQPGTNFSVDLSENSFLPDCYNAVEEGLITSVKNQGNYGTCWAFATIACSEANLIKQNMMGTDGDLSELHLAYFAYHPEVDPLGGTKGDGYNKEEASRYLNIGGNYYIAMTALANWMGVADESVAPYGGLTTVDSAYAYDKDVAHLENVKMIPMKNRDEVKRNIMENGAAGISYYNYNDFFSEGRKNYYYRPDVNNKSLKGMAHAVAIVGWDDNYPKENFKRNNEDDNIPDNDGAWLIKNSWGDQTNDKGYFWMSYEDSSIDSNASFFIYGKNDNYDYQYQYDGTVSRILLFYTDDTDECETSAANVFVATGKQSLEAVSFFTYSNDINYSIQIYRGLGEAVGPTEGKQALSKEISGFEPYSGYHTIKLNEDLIIEEGERFSVVITISGQAGSARFPFEHTKYSSALANQSYVYVKGNDMWYDATLYDGLETSNCRIKAFTSDVSSEDEEGGNIEEGGNEEEGDSEEGNEDFKVVESVKLINPPNRIYYDYGFNEKLDTTGMKILVNYNDGTSEYVQDGFVVPIVDCSRAGARVVNVKWDDKIIPVEVNIDAGHKITVSKYPYIVQYGRKFSKTDNGKFSITVLFRSGNKRNVSFDECSLLGYSSSVLGKQKVAISYGEGSTAGASVRTDYFYIYSATISKPAVKAVSYNKIRVSWNSSYNFGKYDVYRKDVKNKTVKRVAKSVRNRSYVDNCNVEHDYYYYVIPAAELCGQMRSCELSSSFSSKIRTKLGKVSLISASSKEYNSNLIKWKKLNGASGYIIYRKNSTKAKDVNSGNITDGRQSMSYKAIGYVNKGGTCSYTDKKAVIGVTYTYKVVPYVLVNGKMVKGIASNCKSVKTKPGTVVVKGSLRRGKYTLINWKKVSGASRYEVYGAAKFNGKYKKLATIYKAGLTYREKSLTLKKSPYIKIRAFKIVNGRKIYGSFSKAFKVI